MTPSSRTPYTKAITILAIIFGVSLGLCGLTFAASTGMRGDGQWIIILGLIELAAMILSAIGLVVTVIVWLIASANGYRSSSDPQKLFDDSNDPQP